MADEPELEPGVSTSERQQGTPGARLRAAREAQGLSIQDVATRTRIAQRQLEAIERDDYAALPGIPYAVGFARAYARAIDVDEVAIAADVRNAVHNSEIGANRYEAFEPADPARVPSRALAWTAAAIVVILIAAFAVWRTQLLTPPTGEEIAQQQQAAPVAATRPAAGARRPAPVVQTVVFTANDDVWLRIYDEAGDRLKDGLMKKGESFTLPPNARNPMILTGRPQALTVTVGGKAVAPLGPPDRTISDVPVNAEALLARAAPAAPAGAAAAPAGNPGVATPAPPPAVPTPAPVGGN
ncbi:helix-turn-helix domain-containing protein [Sphingobium bisphenolivorans]|uniref:helix-turn-helix domain-containing protein n=1 Tax=Sphingobium bisphenolivorans TaxID=1335760 RepID=UPI0003A912E7|nr:helix-turn-helix domain-containing protein [Sphingobium bisphenolivorans]